MKTMNETHWNVSRETFYLMRKFKIGIALGGGGVRGLAHIGIFRILEKNGIVPDIIAGTSMGAVVGALYAWKPDAAGLEEKVIGILKSGIIDEIGSQFSKAVPKRPFGRVLSLAKQFFILNRAVVSPAIFSASYAKKLFAGCGLPEFFSDLKIPFCAVATDIGHGEEKTFWGGNLQEAVAASSSIAGIFPPVEIEGSYYLDGATVNSVPISPLSNYCDFIIACDVRPERRIIPSFKRGLEVLSRTDAISSYKLSDIQIQEADFVIKPKVGGIHWANFKRTSESISKGAEACEKALPKLKKRLLQRKISSFPRRLLSGKCRRLPQE